MLQCSSERTITAALVLFTTTLGLALAATVPAPPSASLKLAALADEHWDWQMRTHPTWATYLGDHRFDAELEDLGPRAHAARHGRMLRLRARLAELPTGALSPEERVTHRVLDETLATGVMPAFARLHRFLASGVPMKPKSRDAPALTWFT